MEVLEELLAQIQAAFAGVPRPEQFTNYKHCEECCEHNDTLRRHTPDTLTLKEVGNPGWDPICFTLPEAFQYFLPGLIRLANAAPYDYLDQLLFHLTYQSDRVQSLSIPQKRAILAWLMAMDAEYKIAAGEDPTANSMQLALQYLQA